MQLSNFLLSAVASIVLLQANTAAALPMAQLDVRSEAVNAPIEARSDFVEEKRDITLVTRATPLAGSEGGYCLPS